VLYSYSITPLAENEFEQRSADIVAQVKRGAFTMPLFCLVLVPEGDPVWDKAGKMAKLYARYRDRLAQDGVETGILVQASLGHGYTITPAPFQNYVGLEPHGEDGCDPAINTTYAYCPLDKGFVDHFCDVMRTLAKERPRVIMLDDDFRLTMRSGRGCACPRHLAEFNRRTGKGWSRQELWAHVGSHPNDDALTRQFTDTQQEALVEAARAFRAAIDEVDPTIQGINCISGHLCESGDAVNKVFAGKGNPTIVRIGNGCYAPYAVRDFSRGIINAAITARKMKKRGIDVILAETDTIPFNRYAKSARYLHSHFTASLLEGLSGAKHWLTRTSAFEPESGKAYRDILAKHHGMYERLTELARDIRWEGVSATFVQQEDMKQQGNIWDYHTHDLVQKNLERMGLPFYLSDEPEKLNFIEGAVAGDLTDEQLERLFETSVFADGLAAKILVQRGYGDRLGVTVEDWDLGVCHGETFDGTLDQCCITQKNALKLIPTDPCTEVLTHNYYCQDGFAQPLSPAVTCLDRGESRLSVVFCGSFSYPFTYTEGFAFLNESRKAQLASLFTRAGALPVYCVGDDEICFKVGRLPDGRRIACVYLLGVDPMEELRLHLDETPHSISVMLPDGTEQPVSFTAAGDVYTLDLRVESMYPVILLIQ